MNPGLLTGRCNRRSLRTNKASSFSTDRTERSPTHRDLPFLSILTEETSIWNYLSKKLCYTTIYICLFFDSSNRDLSSRYRKIPYNPHSVSMSSPTYPSSITSKCEQKNSLAYNFQDYSGDLLSSPKTAVDIQCEIMVGNCKTFPHRKQFAIFIGFKTSL